MEVGDGNGKRGREWKSKAGMRDIADCLTLRRLRGGGKNSRQRIFGGWRNAAHHRPLATPRDRFALAPPPASGGG